MREYDEAIAVGGGARSRPHKTTVEFLVPLTILAGLTVLFRTTGLDLALSALFFTQGGGWTHSSNTICMLLYNYGTWPPIAMSVLAGLAFVAGFFRHALSRYRKPALFILLLLALGPGLIVNALLKSHADRPRPRDVTAFSGDRQFQKVLDIGSSNQGRAFPSGHASMGFFLGAPYFIYRRSNPGRAALWLLAGLAYGGAIGIVRMAQGGHFASDIVWAWGIVHLCGLCLSHLMQLDRRQAGHMLLPGE